MTIINFFNILFLQLRPLLLKQPLPLLLPRLDNDINININAETSTGSEFLSLLRISEFFRFI